MTLDIHFFKTDGKNKYILRYSHDRTNFKCKLVKHTYIVTRSKVNRYVHTCIVPLYLTRAPLGYFYNAAPLGGGGLFRAPL